MSFKGKKIRTGKIKSENLNDKIKINQSDDFLFYDREIQKQIDNLRNSKLEESKRLNKVPMRDNTKYRLKNLTIQNDNLYLDIHHIGYKNTGQAKFFLEQIENKYGENAYTKCKVSK